MFDRFLMDFGTPKRLQKSTPEGALDTSSARLARQELSKSALGKRLKRHLKKDQHLTNKGPLLRLGADPVLGGSAAEAGRVKAFLADRPGQGRGFYPKHALTASGGRRIDYGSANTADHLC